MHDGSGSKLGGGGYSVEQGPGSFHDTFYREAARMRNSGVRKSCVFCFNPTQFLDLLNNN